MIEQRWGATVARARRLPEEMWYEQVDDEFSFVETLRHLIFATDAWFSRMVLGKERPWHPWGLALFLDDPAELGIDPRAKPSLDEVLEVRRGRMDAVGRSLASLTAGELARTCEPPAAPGHPNSATPLLRCFHVILDEEWEHNGYANRDLEILEARQS
ncbi:MAG: DinB family protein [Acidimicrobiales bacterium]